MKMKEKSLVVEKVNIPSKPKPVRHIVLAEEGNPRVPVFPCYRNVKTIFNGFNNDVDAFLEKYPETRFISKEEAIILYAFCKTSQRFQFSKDVVLNPRCSSYCKCIFKIEDGRWITWKTNDRGKFYSTQVFSNVKDACYHLISSSNLSNVELDCQEYFANFLGNDYCHSNYPSIEELEEFIVILDYGIVKTKILK